MSALPRSKVPQRSRVRAAGQPVALRRLFPLPMWLLIRAALAPRPFARTTMFHRWRRLRVN
jgi:hypothetical protein